MSLPSAMEGTNTGPTLRSLSSRRLIESAVTTLPQVNNSTKQAPTLQRGTPSAPSSSSRQQQQKIDDGVQEGSLPQQMHVPREPRDGQRSISRPLPSKVEHSVSSLPELNGGSGMLQQQIKGPPIPGNVGKLEHSEVGAAIAAPSSSAAIIEYQPLQIGLENLGNTCFMNTSLQCLLHIQPLVSYFLRPDLERGINAKSPAKGSLARSFAQLCRDVFSAKRNSIAPTNFQKAVGVLAPHLLDFQQQDCQEFLRFLLDGMSEDLCRSAMSAPEVMDAAEPVAVALIDAESLASKAAKANAASKLRAATRGAAQENQQQGSDGVGDDDGTLGLDKLSISASNVKSHDLQVNHYQQQQQQQQLDHSSSGGEDMNLMVSSEKDDSDAAMARRRSRRVVNRSDSGKKGNTANWVGPPVDTATAACAPHEEAGDRSEQCSSDDASKGKVGELADTAWAQYLRKNDSIITDLFAGQLQSTIECQTCFKRSMCFDPFLDLSVPIPKSEGKATSAFARKAEARCTLDECLSKFTSVEVLDDMYSCEHCKEKRKGHKTLSLYKFPKILLIHIKRFRFNSTSREKLSTDVQFPSTNLDLSTYSSIDRPSTSGANAPIYDLIAVSSHSGGLNGGHYIANVDINNSGRSALSAASSNWVCFNDARTSQTNLNSIAGPSAYVLFYRQKGL